MKILFFISFVFVLFTNKVQAQDLTNYYVNNAFPLCSSSYVRGANEVFQASSGFVCAGTQAKFYYIFEPEVDQVLSTAGTNKIAFRGFSNTAGTTAMALSYKLYGPFNPDQGYASLIESNTVSPLAAGSAITGWQYVNATVLANKHYVLEVLATDADCAGKIQFELKEAPRLVCPDSRDCESCIPKFQPLTGQYVVTGWVKEQGGEAKTSYTNCVMKVITGTTTTAIPVSGQIVDGWQRMEKTVPGSSAGDFAIELTSLSGECYFDDIRVIPYDGSMVSYVYDPVTMRLIAELDERNYAKVYEYDEEGKLIRVKKETEKGFMTITEINENSATKESY